MRIRLLTFFTVLSGFSSLSFAHGVAEADGTFIEQANGVSIVPFIYLGAKHMVTGYDHLLFLLGVIFFLHRLRDVAVYVTLFAFGHSLTLLYGVFSGHQINVYLIDSIIALSVIYKALDNLDAFQRWFGWQPDNRKAVLLFGLCHGFGLASKLQDLQIPANGLIGNMIAFNLGVEVGQLLALSFMVAILAFWRQRTDFLKYSLQVNSLVMCAGFLLLGYQLTGFLLESRGVF